MDNKKLAVQFEKSLIKHDMLLDEMVEIDMVLSDWQGQEQEA